MCVKRAYVPESNSPYIVNRVCIHMLCVPVCVCVCVRVSPVSIHSCTHRRYFTAAFVSLR